VDEVQLRFPLITGSVVGQPNTGPILVEKARVGKSIALDLAKLGDTSDRLAAPLLPQFEQAGLSVQPRSARFARLGTFAYRPTGESLGGGALRDEAGKGLVLAYFDAPCRVTGTLRIGPVEASHDLTITHRGFHWLTVDEIGKDRYSVRNRPPPGSVTFVIILPEPADRRT